MTDNIAQNIVNRLNKINVGISELLPDYTAKTFKISIPKLPNMNLAVSKKQEENRQYDKEKAKDIEKTVNYNITLNIDKVNNGDKRDIETLAKELQFYLKKLEEAKG